MRGEGAMRWFVLPLRCGASAALLWLVLRAVEVEQAAARLGSARPELVAAALAVLAGQAVLAGARWRLVAGRPPLSGFIRLSLIGQFCNQVVPGGLGGDAVRAWLDHRSGAPLADAVQGTVVDRAAGLVSLLALVLLTAPLRQAVVPDGAARAAIDGAAAAGLAAVGALVAAGPWLARRGGPSRATRFAAALAARARTLAAAPGAALAVLAVSTAIHLASLAALWLLARALDVPVEAARIVAVGPPVLLASALPVSVAGWGVREGAAVVALGASGVPGGAALALSAAFGLAVLAVSLPGGVLWLLPEGRGARARRAAPAEAL
jgi:uncharacterized membrane protein YbhN (UPF0104 family)